MKQNFLKISAIALSTLLTSNVFAVLPGPYGGVGLGLARIIIPSGNVFNAGSVGGTESKDIGELDGKILLGYNFNHYIGLEGSFYDYARSVYQAQVFHGPDGQLRYTMSSLNLMTKGYFPIAKGTLFRSDVYLMGGLCEAWSNINYQNNGVPISEGWDAENFPLGGTDTSKLRPIFGGGIHYRIPKTAVMVEIEYTRLDGVGNPKTDPRAIPNADLFTFNVLYSFLKTIPDEAELT